MKLSEILVHEAGMFSGTMLHAIHAVDNLHRWPALPSIPVILSRARLEQGAYHYLSRPNRSLAIRISRVASHPAWTLLHEVGHVLAHLVLGNPKIGFASDHDPLFDEIAECWKQTEVVRRIRGLLQIKGRYARPRAKRDLADQLTARELWARTYAQWACMASNDPFLQREMESVRDEGHFFAGTHCSLQWEDNEFKSIMQAVDDLLRKRELI